MRIREPVAAGRLYPTDPQRCQDELIRLLKDAAQDGVKTHMPVGGVVPFAHWMQGGAVLARVFSEIAEKRSPDVLILFGGLRRIRGQAAALFGSGKWESPLGPVAIDERLAERILGHSNLILDDPYAHENEYCIEIQVPFVRHLFPKSKFVPILVPEMREAVRVGEAVAGTLRAYRYDAVVVGITEFFRHSPSDVETSQGTIREFELATDEHRHRSYLELLRNLRAEELMRKTTRQGQDRSRGAIAATLAACAAMGAVGGQVRRIHGPENATRPSDAEDLQPFSDYFGLVFGRTSTVQD